MTQAPGPFSTRMTRCPTAFDPERGREAGEGYGDLPDPLRDLIVGAGGSSPFLKTLIERERDWAVQVLDSPPEAARDAVLAGVEALDEPALKSGLREARRRIALLTALADLGGVWSLEEVTGTLTAFADAAVDRTIVCLVEALVRRGKLPAPKEGTTTRAGGMVAIAMGKMGAFELNYSSDIDLICLFDHSLYSADDYDDARAGFVRATRTMAQVLSDLTADGYVFRTDLRLRPDASVTPVCLPMEAAERYYESMGRTWERAAHIKARAAAGRHRARARPISTISRPSSGADTSTMPRSRTRRTCGSRSASTRACRARPACRITTSSSARAASARSSSSPRPGSSSPAGATPSLRLRGTVEALARLAEKGWVEADAAGILTDDYRAHRELEHRIQMINDQQTARLPKDDEGMTRIACLMGIETDALRADIAARLERVSALTDDFFAPETRRSEAPDLSPAARKIVERWSSYPALRSHRAVELFDRVRPALLARLGRATNPDEALAHIDGFLAGLPAGVQLFALFDSNPQLVDLIVDIADVSPELARYLSRNSAVFDAVIGGRILRALAR